MAYWIYRYRLSRQSGGLARRRQTLDDYWQWQYDTSAEYFAKFFDLAARLPHARVIDIGCGLGGRTCYLAEAGAGQVVGLDINSTEIAQARDLSNRRLEAGVRAKLRFHAAGELPSHQESEQFDIALLVDALEHVRNPTETLNQAYAYLRPGGVCYFSTWGWYHHQASHLGSIIPIPFATLFFSDRAILDAVRRMVVQPYYQPSQWDSDPPLLRWQNVHSLHDRPGEYLNKTTIRGFRRAMRESRFEQSQLSAAGFSPTRHRRLAHLNFLAKVPLVQEIYHSAVFGRLTKHPNRMAHAEFTPLRRAS